jgi:hypothetical protein
MSIALERFCWTVLWMMISNMVLSVFISVSGIVVRVTVPSFAFTKTEPNSASATEDTTCLSIGVWQRSGPLVRVLWMSLFCYPFRINPHFLT